MNLPPKAAEFAREVCERAGIELHQVLGRDRHRRISVVRARVAERWQGEGYSASEIGRWLGRHHTTVLYMLRACAWRREDLYRRAAGAERISFKTWDQVTNGEKKP